MKGALESARNLWKEKQEARAVKRQKREEAQNASVATSSNAPNVEHSERDHEGSQGEATAELGYSPATELEEVSEPRHSDSQLPLLQAQGQDRNLSIAERRPRRSTKLPKRYRDILPTPLSSLDSGNSQPSGELGTASVPPIQPPITDGEGPVASVRSLQTEPFRSSKNAFGLFRHYITPPSHDPEKALNLLDLHDIPQAPTHSVSQRSDAESEPNRHPESLSVVVGHKYGPYPNRSSFLLGEWFWGSKSKSLNDFKSLVKIMKDDSFCLDEIRDISWDNINSVLGGAPDPSQVPEDLSWRNLLANDSGWIKEEVWINVPFGRGTNSPDAQEYLVGEFYRRSIVSVLRERLSDEDSQFFHMEPYELYWQPDHNTSAQKVYGELYSSRTFLEEHNRLQSLPPEPGCELPRVVAGLILAIDETHLTQFGNTKLHPLYMYLGNNSKYLRSKPAKNLCSHIAYFIKLPNDFREYYRARNDGKSPGQNIVPHCLRETIHAQWRSVLDDEFVEAYEHGTVLTCKFDGKQRRFYPRIFVIIADYPEKAVLTGIRCMGDYPCPRCRIPKTQIPNMGMARDKWWRARKARVDNNEHRDKMKLAHQAIYLDKYAIKSLPVEQLLKDESLTPSQNAFSQRLSHLGFDVFRAVPVDLMHEIESGTWEALFLHLLRIVEFVGGHLLDVLDSRYRATPQFGRDAIRKFRRNCSSLGHMATHEWEDLLQCAIPAFDGLVTGPNNARILKLLFVFASWHGFAKLRMHTDDTLAFLEELTFDLGRLLRDFRTKTCPDYATKELAKETQARYRRTKAAAAKHAQQGSRKQTQKVQPKGPAKETSEDPAVTAGDDMSSAPKSVIFSLFTYKLHAMGDYVEAIKALGTVDSYSTELAELQHRKPKAQYSRTSKKDFVRQITQIERREARLRRIRDSLSCISSDATQRDVEDPPSVRSSAQATDLLSQRYIIGKSQNESIHLGQFILQNAGDPAIKDFFPKLKAHIAFRAQLSFPENAESTLNIDLDTALFFQRDRIYTHRVIRFNYTTYDVRREQDLVNPNSTQCNIMLLNRKENGTHPYLYAKVLKIFHANAIFRVGDPDPRRFDCLWVRWYKHREPKTLFELHKVGLGSTRDPDSYGFVDPVDVIRACHIVPVFAGGKRFSEEDHGTSKLAKDRDDWMEYYISQFADRDLLMRFHFGKGVGHTNCNVHRPQQSSVLPQDSGTLSTAPDIRSYDGPEEELEPSKDGEDDCEAVDIDNRGPDGTIQDHESEASDDDLNDEEFYDRHLYYRL